MILVYIAIAIFLQVLYVNIAQKVLDFWNGYLVLKKAGVKVPVSWITIYLTIALFLFIVFHITAIVFVFVVLE
jgi:hypothetical protein